jgi:spore cortex protein
LNRGKKASVLTAIALLTTTGLAACNTDQGALDTRYNDNTRPIGYYSNENSNRDNEGPITEMMDGMNNNRNNNNFLRVNDRNYNRNVNNPVGPLGEGNNASVGDTLYSRNDANYHGQIKNVGYYNNDDNEIHRKVKTAVEKIDNVDKANVLVTDNNILVAVDTNDRNDAAMKNKITNTVEKMADGRNVDVVTDEGTFTRVRNIDNNIQNGVDRKTIDADVNNLMNDVGNAVQRPFTRNRD